MMRIAAACRHRWMDIAAGALQKCSQCGSVRVAKQHKWHAKPQHYNGFWYASTAECQYAQELDLRKRTGDIRAWRRQVEIPLVINGSKICSHRVDFLVEHNDGSQELVEVKGFRTREWKIKRKLFEALYPGRQYTVISV